MGTDKRERQKVGRYERAAAELDAARRQKRRRTAVRVAVGVVAVLALLFGYTQLVADDGSETETADDTTTTTAGTPSTTVAYTNPDLAEEVLAREAPDPEPPPGDTPADALETETLIEGEGAGAAAGDQVTVHYIGKLADGTVFDQSWERGQPVPVTLGQGAVIAGWDEGLVGAKIGERRHLVIGSENAYGAEGRQSIPADAPLSFTVDIVDIQPPTEAPASSTETPPTTG